MRSWAALGAYVGGLGPLLGLVLAVLGRSWRLCGRSLAEKCEEHGYATLNMWLFLERERDLRPGERSWAALEACVGGLGPLLEPIHVGGLGAVLGRSWGLCWRSWALCWRCWAALGPYVGGLGPLLEPMWQKNTKNVATLKMCLFLERECDLRPGDRSWAALGPYVGGLGSLLGLMLAVLGRSWGHVGGLGPLLGRMWAVWGRKM